MQGTRGGSADSAMRTSGALLLAVVGWNAAWAADPAFETSARDGIRSGGGYFVHNNMWNSAKYSPCSQTLYARSYSDWYVVAKMGNGPRDGAVKTYPNSHRDYADVPVCSFDTITSTFAEKSPGAGTYNVAFDIWLNTPPKPDHNEVMIWTDNQSSWGRLPSGKHLETLTFGGRQYRAFRTDDVPSRVRVATLLLGRSLRHAAPDEVRDLLTKLYRQDADAARFVDSILRGRRMPPELPRPFEWIRRQR